MSKFLTGLRPKDIVLVLAVMASGFESGLLGIGGGIILVPCLIFIGGLDQKTAHGTSLFGIVFLSASGLAGYIIDGSVNYWAGLAIFCGALLGASLGTWQLNNLPVKYLKLLFGLLSFVVAVRLVFGLEGSLEDEEITFIMGLGLFALGIGSGFLSGLLGVGGGMVLVPTLILIFDFIGEEARGTSLFVILPTALYGTLRNVRYENVNLKMGALVGVAGATTAILGAFISQRIPERAVSVIFGITLLAVAAKMFWEYRQEAGRAQPNNTSAA